MLTIYIACLIFGGALLALSLITGGEHSSGGAVDHSLDTHIDTDHSLDIHSDINMHIDSADTHIDTVDTHIDTVSGHEIDTHHGDADLMHHATSSTPEAVKFFSFRYIIYFLAFFGLTGTTLSLLAASSFITFLSSIGLGSFAYYTGFRFMKYLKGSESGEALNVVELNGKTCKVTLFTSKTQKGKVLVECQAQFIELIARVSDSSTKDEFKQGDKALIIEINNNTAYIIDADF